MSKTVSAAQKKPKMHSFKLLGRLLGYLFHYYKGRMIAVFVCIAVTAAAGISSSVFLQLVLSEVITPLTEEGAQWSEVSGPLFWIIFGMGAMYVVALCASFFYNQTMAIVTQGFLRHVRDDMFSEMQSLPIRYFDTHTHGDIMSVYTNDTDALRQLISVLLGTKMQQRVFLLHLLRKRIPQMCAVLDAGDHIRLQQHVLTNTRTGAADHGQLKMRQTAQIDLPRAHPANEGAGRTRARQDEPVIRIQAERIQRVQAEADLRRAKLCGQRALRFQQIFQLLSAAICGDADASALQRPGDRKLRMQTHAFSRHDDGRRAKLCGMHALRQLMQRRTEHPLTALSALRNDGRRDLRIHP